MIPYLVMDMKILLKTLVVFGIIAVIRSEQYFNCYKDKCLRGLQHCVHLEKEYRCFPCKDMVDQCGEEAMPRDCDSFCLGLELKRIEAELNVTRTARLHLEENIMLLNQSLAAAYNEINHVNGENTKLSRENDKLELKINRTKESYQRLHHQHIKLSNTSRQTDENLVECLYLKWILVPVVAVAMTFAVLAFVVVLVCLKRKHHKRGRDKSQKPGDQDTTEQTLLITMDSGESTKNNERLKDSGMDLSGDNRSGNSSDVSDTEVDVSPSLQVDRSLVSHVRAEPTVLQKSLDVQNVEVESTVPDKSLATNNVRVEREFENPRSSKGTPAVLKGISPTRDSSSQSNLHETVCS